MKAKQKGALLAFEPNLSVTATQVVIYQKPARLEHFIPITDRHDYAQLLLTMEKCAFLAKEKRKKETKNDAISRMELFI